MSEESLLAIAKYRAALNAWRDTHTYTVQEIDGMEWLICEACHWPPALDGRCWCDQEEEEKS